MRAYSEDLRHLNPIEEAFAKIKDMLRQAGARTKDALVEVLGEAISAISAQDARGYFEHAGYALFDEASPSTIAFVQSFAGGALLTMLADTMMPEAFRYGGKQAGLLTTLGFALAFAITTIE